MRSSALHQLLYANSHEWVIENREHTCRIRHKTLLQLLSRGITAFQHDDGEHDNSNQEHSNEHSERDNN